MKHTNSKKERYEAPKTETALFKAERGFAGSGGPANGAGLKIDTELIYGC